MTELADRIGEQEIVEAVAAALRGEGLTASSQDTGGDVDCVVIEFPDHGEIIWGTADMTWAAAIHDADGEYVSSIKTTCPSDSQDVTVISAAIRDASIAAGAVRAEQ